MLYSTSESFNARHLSPEDVARTFVAHERFEELCLNSNVVLLGPRGSGKTTLLKMLTTPALYTWADPRAEILREQIPFCAIYIPTDVHWQHQLRHSLERLSGYPDLTQRFSQAAVTTNVLHAVCRTFQDVVQYKYGVDLVRETSVCATLVSEWKLPRTVPTFEGVQQALRSRISSLYSLAERAVSAYEIDPDLSHLPEYFFLDYIAAASVACGAFDLLFRPASYRRWALCFDELELAPSWLQERLFNELRSTHPEFLFKLSTSPTPQRGSFTGASERNDFRAIRLWPHADSDLRPFSNRLVRSIIARRTKSAISPDELFGSSPLSGTGDESEYERGSPTWEAMRELASYDEGFAAVLVRNGINPADPTTADITKRDQVLRKAKPLVLFRRAFTKPGRNGAPSARRSRKVLPIYSGKDAIYDVADGNPRWLISIVDDLLVRMPKARVGQPQRIRPKVQATILRTVSEQFGALIQALPEATAEFEDGEVTLYGLLQRIAAYFFHGLTQRRFSLDPYGSFVVDDAVPEPLMGLLRKAVYEGAIVLVDPTENAISSDLVGRRFRLSYRLAPTLRLPLRLYEAVPLSRCLEYQGGRRADRAIDDDVPHSGTIQADLELGWNT